MCVLPFFPFIDLLLGLFLRDPVLFLDMTGELVLPSGDLVDMIIGELAPLLFHFTLELLPVAFYLIPVHFWLLL